MTEIMVEEGGNDGNKRPCGATGLTRDQIIDMRHPRWTPRQRRFALNYRRHLNASRAVLEAGYGASPEWARKCGHALLAKAHIKQYMEACDAAERERYELSSDRVLGELSKIAFFNLADYIKINEEGDAYIDLSHADAAALAALSEATVETYMEGSGESAVPVKKVKIKGFDKKGALELLGKHYKLFTDKHEHSGEITMEISDTDQKL